MKFTVTLMKIITSKNKVAISGMKSPSTSKPQSAGLIWSFANTAIEPHMKNTFILPAIGFTKAQLLWASRHDWFFISTSSAVYGWNVFIKDGVTTITVQKLTSYQALRSWAGY